jgi:hypothetical protein
MGRKEQVKRSVEEKREILQEGLKSGNSPRRVASTEWLPTYGTAGEMKRSKEPQRFGGRSAAGGADEEQFKRVKKLERALAASNWRSKS